MGSLRRHSDYRVVLKEELDRRKRRNPSYSQRAFARDLGLRPNRLSEILRAKQGLSGRSGDAVAVRLPFSEEEREHFRQLVLAEHASTAAERARARKAVERYRTSPDYETLEEARFRVIGEWYHLAILELVKLADFRSSVAWVADRLGIDRSIARLAVARLKRLRLIETNGERWKLPAPNHEVAGGYPSETIRRFHDQVLELARAALRDQPVDERDFSAIFTAVPRSRLPEIKDRLNEFWRRIDEEFGSAESPDEVYCLATQLFSLTKARR